VRRRHPIPRRRGLAIPMVMGFCFLAAVFTVMMSTVRVEDKRQSLMTFQQLKAYYMAQGAIQHALLKVRILPNEAYDASALARGICPFVQNPEQGEGPNPIEKPLEDFVSDINTLEDEGGLPLRLAQDVEETWSYQIKSARALTAFTKADEDAGGASRAVVVLEFEAIGYVEDKVKSEGDENRRWETVEKVVEVTRNPPEAD